MTEDKVPIELAMMPATFTANSLAEIEKVAHWIAESGLFKVKNVAQAATLMLLCKRDRMDPMTAFSKYNLHEDGATSIKAQWSRAEFLSRGGKYEILERSRTQCTVRAWAGPQGNPSYMEKPFEITYTIEEARKNGFIRLGGPWDKDPASMLMKEACALVFRVVDPAVGSDFIAETEVEVLSPGTIPPRPPIATFNVEVVHATEAPSRDSEPLPSAEAPAPDPVEYESPAPKPDINSEDPPSYIPEVIAVGEVHWVAGSDGIPVKAKVAAIIASPSGDLLYTMKPLAKRGKKIVTLADIQKSAAKALGLVVGAYAMPPEEKVPEAAPASEPGKVKGKETLPPWVIAMLDWNGKEGGFDKDKFVAYLRRLSTDGHLRGIEQKKAESVFKTMKDSFQKFKATGANMMWGHFVQGINDAPEAPAS
jgi:hypothetical protein